MPFASNIFSITLFLSGIALLVMSIVSLRRLGGASKWFGFVMLAIAWWALTYSAELSMNTLDDMLFCIDLEYLGIALLPAVWIVFIFKFIGKDEWLNARVLAGVFAFPVLTVLAVWTNNMHHLYYASVNVDNSGPFPLLGFQHGPWYILNTIYFYALLLWGLYLMVSKFRNSDPVYRKQNNTILFGALVPWFVNISYLLNLKPFGHIDLTPYAFLLTAFIIGYGLLRFRLFDIIPIAREKVIEALGEGVLVLDSRNRVVDINPGMRRILGYADGKMIGSNIGDVLPPGLAADELLHTNKNSKTETEIERDGQKRFFEVTVTTLFESNTVYSGTILLFKDITEYKITGEKLRKQAEQFSELNHLKDKLFSIISHDLRSPLLSLLDVLQLASEDALTEEEIKTFLPSLRRNVEYTSSLLDNLLMWSKSQLKGELVTPELFDLKTITADRLGFQEKQAVDKHVTINDRVAPDSLVYADKSMVQLVIRNLVSNAVKFSNPGGEITISSTRDATRATVCIADTGVGMTDETLAKLFSNDAHSTRGTNNELGTGLGLLLCKDFVEKNHGTIWAQSAREEGSKFCFTLPVAAAD